MSDLIRELEALSGPGWVETDRHAEEAKNTIRVGRILGLGSASAESAERDGTIVSVLTMPNRPKIVFAVATRGSFGRPSVKEALEAAGLIRGGSDD